MQKQNKMLSKLSQPCMQLGIALINLKAVKPTQSMYHEFISKIEQISQHLAKTNFSAFSKKQISQQLAKKT